MVMKINIKTILFSLLIGLFAISLTNCGDDDNDSNTHNETPENPDNPNKPDNPTETKGWKKLCNFGGTERAGAVGFTINGKIYVGLGYKGNYTYWHIMQDMRQYYNDFWEYNPTTDRWSQKTNFPDTEYGFGIFMDRRYDNYNYSAFSIEDKGYVACKSGLWEYDPTTDTWIKKDNKSSTSPAVASIDKGYISSINNVGYEYNPVNNTWTQKNNLSLSSCTYITYLNDKIYYTVKPNNDNDPWTFYEYNTKTDQVVQKSSISTYYNECAFLASANNKVYAGMKSYNNGSLKEFNPERNEWTDKDSNPPVIIRAGSIAISSSNKFYIGLGHSGDLYANYNNDTRVYSNEFWQYVP